MDLNSSYQVFLPDVDLSEKKFLPDLDPMLTSLPHGTGSKLNLSGTGAKLTTKYTSSRYGTK